MRYEIHFAIMSAKRQPKKPRAGKKKASPGKDQMDDVDGLVLAPSKSQGTAAPTVIGK